MQVNTVLQDWNPRYRKEWLPPNARIHLRQPGESDGRCVHQGLAGILTEGTEKIVCSYIYIYMRPETNTKHMYTYVCMYIYIYIGDHKQT